MTFDPQYIFRVLGGFDITLIFALIIRIINDNNIKQNPRGGYTMKPNLLELKTIEMNELLEKGDQDFKQVELKSIVPIYGYLMYNIEVKDPSGAGVSLKLSNYLKERDFRLFQVDVNHDTNSKYTKTYTLQFIKKGD